MKSVRLPILALVASAVMLFQSAVFAVEHENPGVIELHTSAEASKVDQLHARSYDKVTPHGVDGMKSVSLEPGQFLPVLDILAGGEIAISDDNIVKRPWSSKSFESKGKVQLVLYVAANRGAVRQNKPLTDTLSEKQFSSEQLGTTVIVQMVDTMRFLKGVVVKNVAKNKVKHQTIDFVVDDNGVGLQRWGMKHKSNAVIVLDASGKVLFAKDGPLSVIEIERTIKLIEEQMS
jgi:YtfJ family uncharacterized protein